MRFYLINIEAKRHQWNTQTALLRSLAWLRTHVQRLHCQLRRKKKDVTQSHNLTVLMWVCWIPHHVRVGFSRHFFAGIQIEELVHLWGSQSVSNLQVLHDKHLPRDWLIHRWPRSHLGLWVHLMLKSHLGKKSKTRLWTVKIWRKVYVSRLWACVDLAFFSPHWNLKIRCWKML